MKAKYYMVLVMALTIVFGFTAVCPAYAAVQGQDIDLASARISSVYPQVVAPGLLVSISGRGFGETPGKIQVGDIVVDQFVSWDAKTIWFRMPEGVKDGDKIKVGDVVSDPIRLAPAGSVKVVWRVNLDKAQATVKANAVRYKAPAATALQPPLFIKGQWIKSGPKAGNFEAAWDGGNRVPMCLEEPGTNIWVSEYLFTPANISTLPGTKTIHFALEDNNLKDRRLTMFESDAAFIIKKEWATDIAPGESDPSVKIDLNAGVINVNYGVR